MSDSDLPRRNENTEKARSRKAAENDKIARHRSHIACSAAQLPAHRPFWQQLRPLGQLAGLAKQFDDAFIEIEAPVDAEQQIGMAADLPISQARW